MQVSANYTGASADVVERTITLPIEEQVNGAEGMLYMSSTSANDGQMNLTVTFELGRDADIATVNVNNRVAVALPRLPEEVRRFGITVRKQSPELTLVANLVSPDGSRDALFLSNYALINVLDALKRLPGVGDVGIFGERRYAMRIWLDPERLAKLGLTAADVIAAVREQNVQIAAGRAGSPPALPNQQLDLPLRTKGRLSTVEEFEAIVIRAEPGGSLLRLGDVARVELGAQSYAGFTRLTRPAGHDARHLPAAGGQRARGLRGGARRAGAAVEELPLRRRADGALRPDALRGRVDLRGDPHARSRPCCWSSWSSSSSSRTGAPR